MRQRLAELEERVDFAERLLAKRREGERLAPPGSATPSPTRPRRPRGRTWGTARARRCSYPRRPTCRGAAVSAAGRATHTWGTLRRCARRPPSCPARDWDRSTCGTPP